MVHIVKHDATAPMAVDGNVGWVIRKWGKCGEFVRPAIRQATSLFMDVDPDSLALAFFESPPPPSRPALRCRPHLPPICPRDDSLRPPTTYSATHRTHPTLPIPRKHHVGLYSKN